MAANVAARPVLGSLNNTYPQVPTATYPGAPAWGPETGAGSLGYPPDPGAAPRSPMLTAPNLGPMAATPGFQAPTAVAAPTPTPYGSFTAPSPTALGSDPSYAYDLGEQQKAIQHSAAARGTLLTGGTLKALQKNASGVAAQHYGDIFNRALQTYGTNRDTNQQNFGQSLGAYNAGNDAALNFGRLGLSANQDEYGRARDAYGDESEQALRDAGVTNANSATLHQDQLDEYARQVALQRQRAGGR